MKKFLSLILALAMVFALVACGGNNAAKNDGAKNDTAASDKTDSAMPDSIKIGVMGTMTGEQALDGDNMRGAIALIEKELEAAGGLKVGDKMVKVEFVFGDTEAKPEQAVNVINKLIDQDGVIAVLGPNNSSDCLSSYEVAQAKGIPCISNTATNVKVTQIGDYCFRSCFIDPFQGLCMAQYAVETYDAKTAAILYNNADAYSTGLMESFKKAFEDLGGEIVANEAFAGTDVKDYSAQLTAIMNADPDVFFIPNQNNMVPMMVQQARAMGIDCQLLGCDSWDYDFLPELIGVELGEGTVYTSGYSNGITSAQDFYNNFVELNDFEPGFPSAMMYEAALILLAAIQEAGTVEGAALRDAIANIEIDLPTGAFKFDAERNPIKACAIIQYQGTDRVYISSIEP